MNSGEKRSVFFGNVTRVPNDGSVDYESKTNEGLVILVLSEVSKDLGFNVMMMVEQERRMGRKSAKK